MTFLTQLPWRKPVQHTNRLNELDHEAPAASFQREINRLFHSFFEGFDSPIGQLNPWNAHKPAIDVIDNQDRFEIKADLPGLATDDVELSLKEGVLTLSGEVKREEDSRERNYYRMERSFGSFQRSIKLPDDVDNDSADAQFKNGVLHITFKRHNLPKKAAKTIQIKST